MEGSQFGRGNGTLVEPVMNESEDPLHDQGYDDDGAGNLIG